MDSLADPSLFKVISLISEVFFGILKVFLLIFNLRTNCTNFVSSILLFKWSVRFSWFKVKGLLPSIALTEGSCNSLVNV